MNSRLFSISAALLVGHLGLGSLSARAEEPAYPPPFSEVDKDQDESAILILSQGSTGYLVIPAGKPESRAMDGNLPVT